MIQEPEAKVRSYHYIRYMRDGSVQKITAVVRSRASKKKGKKGKSSGIAELSERLEDSYERELDPTT